MPEPGISSSQFWKCYVLWDCWAFSTTGVVEGINQMIATFKTMSVGRFSCIEYEEVYRGGRVGQPKQYKERQLTMTSTSMSILLLMRQVA
ncbi:hypothetical protein SUGI_0682980 [Cryptomeria japonica]|nr:hypothetical protein SUGI_0682980 [Cryptomeria japonica]